MDDKDFILSEFSDDDVNKYLYDEEPMKEIGEAEKLIEIFTEKEPRHQHRWILVLKEDGTKIGTCGFHCWDFEKKQIEMGYDMKKAFWGKGYMKEATSEIIKFAQKNLDVHTIVANIYPKNTNSASLAKRLGMELTNETSVFEFRGVKYIHDVYALKFQYLTSKMHCVNLS